MKIYVKITERKGKVVGVDELNTWLNAPGI